MTSLDQLHKSSRQVEEREDREQTARAGTRSTQHFLKNNAPLLRVFLRATDGTDTLDQPGIFAEKVLEARSLAIEIAAQAEKIPLDQVSLEKARFFRHEASSIVAQAWDEGIDLDISSVAREIGEAIADADSVYDAETLDWAQITGNGSVAMTMASISLSLSHAVFKYNFRLGNRFVLSTLTSAVVSAVAEAVDIMVPEGASVDDRRSLSQTTLQNFCSLLVQIYEDACREAIEIMDGMPEGKKKVWLQQNSPLRAIITMFKESALDVAHVAADTGRQAIASISGPQYPNLTR